MSDFVTIANVADFREGKIRRYFVSGREIGVVLWDGRWHAFSNRCTHNDFQLHFGYIEDGCIQCPIHNGAFDLESGKAVFGPVTDLPMYEIQVDEESVQVKIEPREVVSLPD